MKKTSKEIQNRAQKMAGSGVTSAYTRNHIQAGAQLSEITNLLQDLPAPSAATNWADVGSLQEVNSKLAEILAFLKSQK